jgi:hypothetical protein
MPDGIEDVIEPPAVAGELVVVVIVRVIVLAIRSVLVAVIVGLDGAQRRHRHVDRPQPPAIAGSRRTSSAGATGVSRPAR